MSNFGHVTVDNFPATQAVSGTIAVSNFPASVEVANDSGSPIPVSGTVAISNLPVTQPVSGTVAVSNFPASTEIANDSGNPIPVSGSVSVSNLPATQPVSGSVSVSNLPTTQPISAASLPLPTGASTEATLAAILAKLIAAPSTSALQTTGNASLVNIDTDLGAAADAEATNSTGSWNVIALLKGILNRPTASTTTSNTTLVTVTTVLAANPLRKGATFFSSTGTIFILLGSGATMSLYSNRLVTNTFWEMPAGYTGAVTAIGAGILLVTELY